MKHSLEPLDGDVLLDQGEELVPAEGTASAYFMHHSPLGLTKMVTPALREESCTVGLEGFHELLCGSLKEQRTPV